MTIGGYMYVIDGGSQDPRTPNPVTLAIQFILAIVIVLLTFDLIEAIQ